MVEVKLDDAELKEGMHAAILAALGEKGQEMIVAEVLKYMTTPVKEQYSSDKREISPLMKKVEWVAFTIAEEIITDKLTNDPAFRESLDKCISDAIKPILNEGPERDSLVSRMSCNISDALKGIWSR